MSGQTFISVPSKNFACGNLAVGYQALYNNTTGYGNLAIGYGALLNNTCGNRNIAIGYNALCSNTTGSTNIAIGNYALLRNIYGCNNIAIGCSALSYNTCGCNNIANGYGTLLYNKFGCNNIAIGYQTLCSNITGSTNIAIGYTAGYYETGSSKLYIANSSTTHPLIFGDFSTNCAIIYGAFKTSGATSLLVAPAAGTTSDAILVWNSSDKLIKTMPYISGGTGGGDKNNIYSKTIITGNTLLTTGSTYVILASGTSITITLPTTPLTGQVFKIKDAYGNALTNNIIINAGSGRTIDGSQCALINTNYGALELMFGATCKWFNLAFIN